MYESAVELIYKNYYFFKFDGEIMYLTAQKAVSNAATYY